MDEMMQSYQVLDLLKHCSPEGMRLLHGCLNVALTINVDVLDDCVIEAWSNGTNLSASVCSRCLWLSCRWRNPESALS